LQLVLGWPVRLIVIGLLLFSVFVDGAGYWYRIANHYPLSGPVAGLPPNFSGWQLYIHKGLDLSGGSLLIYKMTGPTPQGQSESNVQQREIAIITKRVDALGVSEPQVQGQGSDRIEVQLAGVSAAQAQSVIGRTAKLVTTVWVPDSSITGGPFPGYEPKLTALTSEMFTDANASLGQSGSGWQVNVTLSSQGANIMNKLSATAYSAAQSCTTSGSASGCPQGRITEWLDLTQSDINNWNTVGSQLYQETGKGGKLVTDPSVSSSSLGSSFYISGTGINESTAKNLAIDINSGSLPMNLKLLESTDVDASLGASSVRASLLAGLLGLVVVIIFMISLYRLPGLLASAALIFYSGVVLMIFKVYPVTLSLAGLAGFVLSVGMAVDANVLIFERFKEEVRAGRTVGAAVEAAVRRAWPAIRDSNTATIITSMVLYFVSSGEVKGFATTLIIGVLCSLVSSIIVTHNLLNIVLGFGRFRSRWLLGVERG
jgi:preprotein translocase subunit SecD